MRNIKWVIVDTHWDNPDEISTEDDNSGMWYTYTKQKRENKIAQFTLWNLPMKEWIIPAKEKRHEVEIIMPENCSKDLIPKEGVNIFAWNAHMHTAGSAYEFYIIRDGKRIDMMIDHFYDFNF